MPWDRQIFFDMVRDNLFAGTLTQQQVEGMNFKLQVWEDNHEQDISDLRWLAYPLATSKWETAGTMWPIEEYGKGEGSDYGKPDSVTGQCYYGRGDVQLTWAENYQKASQKLQLTGDDDLYWHPDMALDPSISADVMYWGMIEGWFRSGNKLSKFFNENTDDAYGAREIINGDKGYSKDWLPKGVTVGESIAADHRQFLVALEASYVTEAIEPIEPTPQQVLVAITAPRGVEVVVLVNGTEVTS
jgi:hypothetical protein